MKRNSQKKQKTPATRFIYDPSTTAINTSIDDLFERLNRPILYQPPINQPSIIVPDQNYSQTTRSTRKKTKETEEIIPKLKNVASIDNIANVSNQKPSSIKQYFSDINKSDKGQFKKFNGGKKHLIKNKTRKNKK